jgi:hypothetical protein
MRNCGASEGRRCVVDGDKRERVGICEERRSPWSRSQAGSWCTVAVAVAMTETPNTHTPQSPSRARHSPAGPGFVAWMSVTECGL